jgi:predicted porin
MKTIRISCALFAMAMLVFATTVQAQSFEKGKIIITGGYGFGNLSKAILKAYQDETGYKATSLGPIFGKVEYAVSDKVGIGVNVAHVGVSASYEVSDGDGGTNTEKFKWNNTSVLARLNLHFAKSEKLDAYWGAGLGYRFGSWKWESETSENTEEFPFVNPFGFETTIGVRYYFIKNLGVYAEAGIAKAPIQFGLSAAF